MNRRIWRLTVFGAFIGLLVLGGCSSSGLGLANHPADCAIGVAWDDCLPGTAGYNNGGGRLHREQAHRQQMDEIVASSKIALEQCKADTQNPVLDPIREKVELFRVDATVGPSFELASNQSFANDAERTAIAAWANVRSSCNERMARLPRLPPAASQMQMATDRKILEIQLAVRGEVDKLIVALYQQKLTYGEFVQRRYEIGRDGAKAENDFLQAVALADKERQEKAHRVAQEQYNAQIQAWSSFNQALTARQPQSVRVQPVSCMSSRVGNIVNTNCY